MNCININSEEFKSLLNESKLNSLHLEMIISRWQDINNSDKFPSIEEVLRDSSLNYQLKSVDILQSDKAKQVFEKGQKNNWPLDKILTELQVPKEQKQLILDIHQNILNKARVGIIGDIREEIITDLLANYSYIVEINTAKQIISGRTSQSSMESFTLNNELYSIQESEYETYYMRGNKFITREEYSKAKQESINLGEKPTQYYSNLTVPGGTNYTENEISTPLITPSIKGHAQFSTDNGIGWFRSDDKALISKPDDELSFPDEFIDNQGYQWKKINGVWNYFDEYGVDKRDDLTTADMINIHPQKEIFNYYYISKENTKTRRILEVQSDVFQKSRDIKSAEEIYAEMKKSGELIVDCG